MWLRYGSTTVSFLLGNCSATVSARLSDSSTTVSAGLSNSPTAVPFWLGDSSTTVSAGLSDSPAAVPFWLGDSSTTVSAGFSDSPAAVPFWLGNSSTTIPMWPGYASCDSFTRLRELVFDIVNGLGSLRIRRNDGCRYWLDDRAALKGVAMSKTYYIHTLDGVAYLDLVLMSVTVEYYH